MQLNSIPGNTPETTHQVMLPTQEPQRSRFNHRQKLTATFAGLALVGGVGLGLRRQAEHSLSPKTEKTVAGITDHIDTYTPQLDAVQEAGGGAADINYDGVNSDLAHVMYDPPKENAESLYDNAKVEVKLDAPYQPVYSVDKSIADSLIKDVTKPYGISYSKADLKKHGLSSFEASPIIEQAKVDQLLKVNKATHIQSVELLDSGIKFNFYAAHPDGEGEDDYDISINPRALDAVVRIVFDSLGTASVPYLPQSSIDKLKELSHNGGLKDTVMNVVLNGNSSATCLDPNSYGTSGLVYSSEWLANSDRTCAGGFAASELGEDGYSDEIGKLPANLVIVGQGPESSNQDNVWLSKMIGHETAHQMVRLALMKMKDRLVGEDTKDPFIREHTLVTKPAEIALNQAVEDAVTKDAARRNLRPVEYILRSPASKPKDIEASQQESIDLEINAIDDAIQNNKPFDALVMPGQFYAPDRLSKGFDENKGAHGGPSSANTARLLYDNPIVIKRPGANRLPSDPRGYLFGSVYASLNKGAAPKNGNNFYFSAALLEGNELFAPGFGSDGNYTNEPVMLHFSADQQLDTGYLIGIDKFGNSYDVSINNAGVVGDGINNVITTNPENPNNLP